MTERDLFFADIERISRAAKDISQMDDALHASWEMKHRLEQSGWQLDAQMALGFWQLAGKMGHQEWQTQLHWLQMAGHRALLVHVPAGSARDAVIDIIQRLADHPKNLVRVWAIHLAMALYCQCPETQGQMRPLIEQALAAPSKAMQARVRQFLKEPYFSQMPTGKEQLVMLKQLVMPIITPIITPIEGDEAR